MITSTIWVARSTQARVTLTFEDSPSPRMLRTASSAITTSPPMMSHGLWSSGGKKAPR